MITAGRRVLWINKLDGIGGIMNWKNDRPEGWEEKTKSLRRDISQNSCLAMEESEDHELALIDAGVSALLALLRANGTKTDSFRTNHNPIYMSNPNQRGVYVFIPARK